VTRLVRSRQVLLVMPNRVTSGHVISRRSPSFPNWSCRIKSCWSHRIMSEQVPSRRGSLVSPSRISSSHISSGRITFVMSSRISSGQVMLHHAPSHRISFVESRRYSPYLAGALQTKACHVTLVKSSHSLSSTSKPIGSNPVPFKQQL
jgi:hypothetical protein